MAIIAPNLLWRGLWSDPANIGNYMFTVLLIVAFLFSCAACLLSSDVISSERREGTLGLLLLTRVKAIDVLLGKFASVGIGSTCALVTFIPFLMLPLLAGGVTGGEAFRKGIVLLDTLGLSLAVGLWASTRAIEPFRTGARALLTVSAIMLLPAILEVLVRGAAASTSVIGLISPLTTLVAAGDIHYKSHPAIYWTSVALIMAASCAFVGAAARGIRFDLSPSLTNPTLGPNAPTPRALSLGQDGRSDPLAWLIQNQRGQGIWIWIAAVVFWFYLFLVTFLQWLGVVRMSYIVLWPFGVVVSIFIDALIARAASRFLIEAKADGRLEMLLTTTLGARTIVSSHWQALRRLLRVPVYLSIVGGVGWLSLVIVTAPGLTSRDFSWKLQYAIGWGLSGLSYMAGIAAVCWLAICFAARGYTQVGVIARTAGLTTGVPYLFRITTLVGLQVLAVGGLYRSTPWLIFSWLETASVLFFYLWLIGRAQRNIFAVLRVSGPTYGARNSVWSLIREGFTVFRDPPLSTPS